MNFEQISFINVFFSSQSSVDSYDLLEGSTADLLNARITGEIVSLVLIMYQGRNWHGHIRIQQEMAEFFNVSLVCESDTNMTVDVSVHVMRTTSSLTLSLFSPYWIINKTSRVLQYKAENVSVKHPADYRDIILFSFRKKNLFSKSKVRKIPTSDPVEPTLFPIKKFPKCNKQHSLLVGLKTKCNGQFVRMNIIKL